MITNYFGSIVDWRCFSISHAFDPLAMESRACRTAVTWAVDKNIQAILLEGDCKELIDAIMGGKTPIHIQALVHDILHLNKGIQHVRRTERPMRLQLTFSKIQLLLLIPQQSNVIQRPCSS